MIYFSHAALKRNTIYIGSFQTRASVFSNKAMRRENFSSMIFLNGDHRRCHVAIIHAFEIKLFSRSTLYPIRSTMPTLLLCYHLA